MIEYTDVEEQFYIGLVCTTFNIDFFSCYEAQLAEFGFEYKSIAQLSHYIIAVGFCALILLAILNLGLHRFQILSILQVQGTAIKCIHRN